MLASQAGGIYLYLLNLVGGSFPCFLMTKADYRVCLTGQMSCCRQPKSKLQMACEPERLPAIHVRLHW